jgi:hypothetical protein
MKGDSKDEEERSKDDKKGKKRGMLGWFKLRVCSDVLLPYSSFS